MKKYMLALFIAKNAMACTGTVENYYLNHPQLLQQAIKACPTQVPQNISCTQLESMGQRMQALAYQLQYNPQGFGKDILALQEKLGQAEALKSAEPSKPNQELLYRLAVVKWLESPRR